MIDKVYAILRKQDYRVPVVDLIQLQTGDSFRVLVSAIMSARTNDSTTIAAAERLFKRVGRLSDFGNITTSEIEKLIFPVGFYRNKARFLKQLAGVKTIPRTVDELIKLPGVGRKTANLVVAVAFGKPAICVDTHVHKIMNRLGYVQTKTPEQTESALRKKLPKRLWKVTNTIFVAFGQNTCRPISPHCSTCPIRGYCMRVGVTSCR
ncbi:MAG: endonuclease III [archaeon]